MKKEFKVISDLIEEKSRALDIGCGDGNLMEYLLQNKTKDIRGLEISKEKVQNCLSKGFDVSKIKSKNPTLIRPRTLKTWATISSGMLRLNIVTAAVQPERISIHKRSEPS